MFGLNYAKKLIWGVVGGSADSVINKVTGKSLCIDKYITSCEPWTDHVYPNTIKSIKSDFESARILVDIGQKCLKSGY